MPFDVSDAIESAAKAVVDLNDRTIVRSALWAIVWKSKGKWDDRLFTAMTEVAAFLRSNPGTVKAFAERVEIMVDGVFGASDNQICNEQFAVMSEYV